MRLWRTDSSGRASRPRSTRARPCCCLQDVHAAYGRIEALQGISLEVRRGEIVAMLGGNGAGKSTTLKTISGLMHPRSGRIVLEGGT